MTAILGVFQFAQEPVPRGIAQSMLTRMRQRGADEARTWHNGDALLCGSRHRWESGVQSSSGEVIARRDHLAVVVDATLYYREDLRRRIGVSKHEPKADSPSHLILWAYEKWGERCVEFLEGDYACIVYDAKARSVFMTRDFTGQRPLFYSNRGTTLVAASTIGGVVSHPAVRTDLNLAAIAIDASALLYSAGSETCYSDVSVVPAGCAVQVRNADLRVTRWWDPIVRQPSPPPISEAADELRAVLGEAVLQRTSASGSTSVWLSGGRDSTAVFASGQNAIAKEGRAESLHPVSLRLAPDDPLNEDRFIEAAARRWQSSITWLDVADLGPMVSVEDSGRRDEPHRHLFEGLMRRLSDRSLTSGARVALSGHGGDFLFEVSPVILADYLASLRIPSVIREWRALGKQNRPLSGFVHWAIAPLLPRTLGDTIALFRGHQLRGYFERPLPSWLSPTFAKKHDMADRARAGTPRATQGSHAEHELWWFLTEPNFARTASLCAEYALDEGIELRAPILDARVVHLAASRPASERRSLGQSKILLRRAMKGLLPDRVLEPRLFKTGTLATYAAQSMASLAPVMREAFRDSMLEALGIASCKELSRVSERFLSASGTRSTGEQLVSALQCELWLKARLRETDSDVYATQLKEMVRSYA